MRRVMGNAEQKWEELGKQELFLVKKGEIMKEMENYIDKWEESVREWDRKLAEREGLLKRDMRRECMVS